MPRFTSRAYTVEAHQYTGSTGSLPITFAEAIIPQRAGHACLVRCGSEVRPCNLSDWLVRGEDGRIDVLSNGAFEQRFEIVAAPVANGFDDGTTATFFGAPNEPAHEQPPFVDWLGIRFPRGTAVSLAGVSLSSIEAIRLNSHFIVSDPVAADAEPEPEPLPLASKGGTLTLTKKG
jgi:hypothetical protein